MHHGGGVRWGGICFWPAFDRGVGISLVAGIFYVLAWELAQDTVAGDFASNYATAAIAQARADGADAAALAELRAQMESFKTLYAHPMFRLPMTFVEIFTVGGTVPLVSGAVLQTGKAAGRAR